MLATLMLLSFVLFNGALETYYLRVYCTDSYLIFPHCVHLTTVENLLY